MELGRSEVGKCTKVVLVEDSEFFRDAWAMDTSLNLIAFERPEDLFEARATNVNFWRDVLCVITDYFFDHLSDLTGDDVAAWVKDQNGPPVILASEITASAAQKATFKAIISKEPISSAKLRSLLS